MAFAAVSSTAKIAHLRGQLILLPGRRLNLARPWLAAQPIPRQGVKKGEPCLIKGHGPWKKGSGLGES
jgi:hypothetical protein